MITWQVFLRENPNAPATRRGYVLADSEDQARTLSQHPDAILIDSVNMLWPGSQDAVVHWLNRTNGPHSANA